MRLGKRTAMKSYPSPTEEGADKAGEEKATALGDGLTNFSEKPLGRGASALT